MASFVARAAAAASFPSGRSRRLGSGRLPLAPALPGHGAPLVLAGRRVGASHGGVLAMQFMAPARDVKVGCANQATDPADSPGDMSGDDLVKKLDESRRRMPRFRLVNNHFPLTDDDAKALETLERIADEGYTLVTKVANHLRPAPKTDLYKALFSIGNGLTYASRGSGCYRVLGSYPLGLSLLLVVRLDELRRLVSSACNKPLPPTMTLVPMENMKTIENEIVMLVQRVYLSVKSDVTAMIST